MRTQYLPMLVLAAFVALTSGTACGHDSTANPFQDRSSEARITISSIEHDVLLGRWQDAVTHCDAVLSSDAKSEIALFIRNLGRQITFAKCKPGEALSPYDYPFTDVEASSRLRDWIRRIEGNQPNNPNVLCAIGAYHVLVKKDTQQATKTFERVIAIDPTNAFALATVAASYGSANRVDDAVRLSRRALEQQPKCAAAYNNMGMVEMARKQFDKAENFFRKATDCDNAGPMEWFNRGSFYYFRKDLKQAKECLLKAIELSPRMLEAHHNLAGVMYGLGSRQECVKHLRLVVEIDPTSPYASKARQNLRALGY